MLEALTGVYIIFFIVWVLYTIFSVIRYYKMNNKPEFINYYLYDCNSIIGFIASVMVFLHSVLILLYIGSLFYDIFLNNFA